MVKTPNLKPDEFELTVTCPVGACFAQCTYAFSKDVLRENAKFREEVKKNIVIYAEKSHNSGMHDRKVAGK